MRVLIVGAGGVGGYLAAPLSEAGKRPVLLLRGAAAVRVAREGLRLRSARGDWNGTVDVVTAGDLADGAAPPALVVIACRSYDLPGALDALAPAVGTDTAVLPVLNGIAHLGAIAARPGGAPAGRSPSRARGHGAAHPRGHDRRPRMSGLMPHRAVGHPLSSSDGP